MIAPNASSTSKWSQEPPYRPPYRMSIPVLDVIWKAMNLPGKRPPVYTDPNLNEKLGDSAGYVNWDDRFVHMGPKYFQRLRSMGFPGHRDMSGVQVLAHEYAHTAQPQVLKQRVTEGGAEAYAMSRMPAIMRALKIQPGWGPGLGRSAPPEGNRDLWYGVTYPEWTKQMMRGLPYNVQRGQFGR